MKKYFIVLLVVLSTSFCGAQDGVSRYATGCLPEPNPSSLPRQATLMARDFENLPSSYSLKQYCPTPLSQGIYGTCTSWATAYAFRTILEAINYGWTDEDLISEEAFSPLFVYAQIKSYGDDNCSRGSHISAAMRLMKNVGSVKRSTFNYMCTSFVPDNVMQKASDYKLENYVTLIAYGQYIFDSQKISLVKKAIAEDKPVVIAMRVYPSFDRCKDVWDGNYSGQPGYHAMCVVAYDDAKYSEGAFLIMNSWGKSWGNGGFTWVKYSDFCKTVDQAYTGSIPYTPSPVIKKNVLSGSLSIQLSTGENMPPVLDGSGVFPCYQMEGSYISGIRFRLYLTNNEPSYVYIIGFDSNSNTSLVFPPSENVSPALLYKKTHIAIPDEKWYIEMDNNAGTDYLCMLYSLEELDIEAIIKKIKNGKGDFIERLKLALGKKLSLPDEVDFSSDTMSFNAATNATVVPIISVINHK